MSQKQTKKKTNKTQIQDHHIFFSNTSAIKNVIEPAWNYPVWAYDDGNGTGEKKNLRKQE